MKKIFILLAVAGSLFSLNSYADTEAESGFNSMLDISAGYGTKAKSGVFNVGYNLGYQFGFGLYIGAGPEVAASVYSGGSGVSVGGYGKVRYTAVQINSNVLPFIEGRGGYLYDVKNNGGGGTGGVGVGAAFKQKIRVGFFAYLGSYTEVKVTGSGKKMKTTTDKSVTCNPALFLSIDF